MLYNESTGKPKVTHNVFSLEGLIGWLETMPGDGEYDFTNCEGACLLGQYMTSIGEPWSDNRYAEIAIEMCRGYKDLTFYIGVQRPHTFSAALTRARTALASQSKSEA